MSEYTKLELRAAGDGAVMAVDAVFFNPKTATHKYPDFTFRGTVGGVPSILYVPEKSARQQFGRLQMEPEAAVGQMIHFYRAANSDDATRPYWRAEIASKADAAPAPTKRLAGPSIESAPPSHFSTGQTSGGTGVRIGAGTAASPHTVLNPPPTPEPRTRAYLAAAYAWEYRTAFEAQRAVWEALRTAPDAASSLTLSMVPTAASVQAGAATLGIQAEKHGLTFTPLPVSKDDVVQTLGLVPVDEIEDNGQVPF